MLKVVRHGHSFVRVPNPTHIPFIQMQVIFISCNLCRTTEACGADGASCCSGPAGCCNKCFGNSFNNDSLEEELERERAARAAGGDANTTQPGQKESMSKDLPVGNGPGDTQS